MSNVERFVTPPHLDIGATLRPLGMKVAGRRRLTSESGAWASHTPAGPASVTLQRVDAETVQARAVGPGADWLLAAVPALIGLEDHPEGFDPPPGPVAELHRRNPGLRLGKTGRVFDTLVPAVLGQKVTSLAAIKSYRALAWRYGSRAPGTDLWLPPPADDLARIPYWGLHELGVERRRATILVEAARRSRRLEAILDMDRESAWKRLLAVPGLGPWTAAHVMGVAWGDVDAVPVGDYHLPNTVAWVLAGEDRADDARMLELLEPYAGQRRRALLLIKGTGVHAPRYGPRTAVTSFESF